MCPACLASAASVIAGTISLGGLSAITTKILYAKGSARKILSRSPKGKEK